MTPLTELMQQGAAHAWLFIPSAILLGALHGLEPGHSKTMMAAFIVAVRGTVAQAVLLGLAATVSHSFVVWAVALIGLHYASRFDAQTTEPYFQIASAALIVAIAAWMLWRTRHNQHHHHDHHADAHQQAHARQIGQRFAGGTATTGQILVFGLTGGLIPCPAAITVLLLCLQLREVTLGVVLVLCFSIGLALTMVSAGVIAALSLRHVAARWPGLGALAAKAPYLSGAVIICVGLYLGWQGVQTLAHPA